MVDWRAFLDDQRVAHLATADASAAPHVVPVCFARLGDQVYIAIDEKPKRTVHLKRVRNIVENPRVALVADVYDEDWTRLGWVQLRGVARVLSDGDEYADALRALRARYQQYQSMALEGRPVIAIDVESATSWGTARAAGAGHGDHGL